MRVVRAAALGLAVLAPDVAAAGGGACSAAARDAGWVPPPITAGQVPVSIDEAVRRLAGERVVVVGEAHDRFGDHLLQLEILCRLHRARPGLGLGVEWVQQPFQAPLDRFVAGALDRDGLLREVEYFTRWGYDWRLYAPIFEFARDARIPMVALNVRGEATRAVVRGDLASLDERQRDLLPPRAEEDADYVGRIRAVFDAHPIAGEARFEHFLDAQRLWDEAMAERAARWLDAHPGRPLLVMLGAGHADPLAVPARIRRRSGARVAVVMPVEPDAAPAPDGIDFVARVAPVDLPRAGMLGVGLGGTGGDGDLVVRSFADPSAARDAGLRLGDRIVTIDGRAVSAYPDLKLALLGRAPGDRVRVEVVREDPGGAPRPLDFSFELR